MALLGEKIGGTQKITYRSMRRMGITLGPRGALRGNVRDGCRHLVTDTKEGWLGFETRLKLKDQGQSEQNSENT